MGYLQSGFVDEVAHTNSLHNAYAAKLQDNAVKRSALLKQCLGILKSAQHNLIVLAGKPGSGKSSLMVSTLLLSLREII
jgi:DNA replication protein DnaC